MERPWEQSFILFALLSANWSKNARHFLRHIARNKTKTNGDLLARVFRFPVLHERAIYMHLLPDLIGSFVLSVNLVLRAFPLLPIYKEKAVGTRLVVCVLIG